METKGISFFKITTGSAPKPPTRTVFAWGRCMSHPVPQDQELRRLPQSASAARSLALPQSPQRATGPKEARFFLGVVVYFLDEVPSCRLGACVFENYASQCAPRDGTGRLPSSALAVNAQKRTREAGCGGRRECACALGRLVLFCPNHCKQAEAGAGWEWGSQGRSGAQRRRRLRWLRWQREREEEVAVAGAVGRAAAGSGW